MNKLQTYQAEVWAVYKDSIYEAINALRIGLENTQQRERVGIILGDSAIKNLFQKQISVIEKAIETLQSEPINSLMGLNESLKEAHKIIEVLYMNALDNHKESWPRANEWLEKHKEFKSQT